MESNTRTVDLFDRYAGNFAQFTDALISTGRYTRGYLFEAAARQNVKPGKLILDYGCGPGRIAHSLARAGFNVLGVDCSTEMIQQARQLPKTEMELRFLSLGECTELFKPSAYSGIVCSSVIEFVDDAGQLLRSFYQALEPGGIVIISFANSRSVWRKYTEYHRDRHPHLSVQRHVWNWPTARKIFGAAGFDVMPGPLYFESPFDTYPILKSLSTLGVVGTLGIAVLRKPAE